MLTVLGVLVVSVQHLVSGMLLGPDVRGPLHPPGDGAGHAAEPAPQADYPIIHTGWHVVACAMVALMYISILHELRISTESPLQAYRLLGLVAMGSCWSWQLYIDSICNTDCLPVSVLR